MLVRCHHCQSEVEKSTGHVNRSAKMGGKLFCGRVCFGLDRRVEATEAEKKEAKRVYDRQYRLRDIEARKAAKKEYYQRTRDPVKEAAIRKAKMPQHVAYCQRPEYVAWKSEYDKQLRAGEYGEFAEVYLLLLDLDKEIRSQATAYERRVANGYYTRNAQKRRRELCRMNKLNSMRAI